MYTRRKFIKTSALAGAAGLSGAFSPGMSSCSKPPKKITIRIIKIGQLWRVIIHTLMQVGEQCKMEFLTLMETFMLKAVEFLRIQNIIWNFSRINIRKSMSLTSALSAFQSLIERY
jgi:hypothetical protein